jgi:hypothetical protein
MRIPDHAMKNHAPRFFTTIAAAVLIFGITAASAFTLEIKPLVKAPEHTTGGVETDPKLVFRFFDEDFVSGGYQYGYPEQSKVFIPEESGKNGEVSLQFDLIANDYSGGSVCLYNLLYDLTPYYQTSALAFWIKGAAGGEVAWVALVDEENADSKKTVVRLPINNFGGIKKEWTHIVVPLADFGKRGVFWDAKKRVEIPEQFEWNAVAEFRIEIKKNDNPSFRVWVDDIFILRDMVTPRPEKNEVLWEDRKVAATTPPYAAQPKVEVLHSLFDNDLPPGSFTYVYGGKTAVAVRPSANDPNRNVLCMYQDNADYSGVTVALGQGRNIDLSGLRTSKAGLAFWAKAAPKVKSVFVGLLDDESDGKKVQTKQPISDFGELDTSWKYFMIPLKRFLASGLWYDANRKAEIADPVVWNAINEIRFSVNKGENRVPDNEPVVLYIDKLSVIREIPGWIDPNQYWASFTSDKADATLHDFEAEKDKGWEKSSGAKSSVSFAAVATPPEKGRSGNWSLAITYKLADYCDVYYDYGTTAAPKEKRDWTKHWGIMFSLYTDKPYQAVTVQVNDGGNEVFVANTGGKKGWNELLVPFKAFSKFPYYQPPDAVQNGVFDLVNVRRIDFKPAGDGTSGGFIIDNVRLTNLRSAPEAKVAATVALTCSVDTAKAVAKSVNPGIFGINTALWDGDLLSDKTVSFVKDVNHGVLRYPGGLRADEDHWEEVLKKKDWLVDIDEFLDFCGKTGTTPMITANFGTGTPQEAAAWVRHTNVEKKANVRLWEIGNELYGNWHANNCTPEEYGKRTAEFIKAMKAVDPSILIGVVWVLDGEWNKKVFEHLRDLADAVIVHHYPQHSGEENDPGLLAAPRSLNDIIPSVKRQLAEYGAKGKKYQIWLTEWNSVDFKPGPQTLSMVNGLFVASYLGIVATHNIEQASYWDIHNDMTPQGGDYGYLSRTGAPDGDNTPRPSYFAFLLASRSLRGEMYKTSCGDDNVEALYTRRPDGTKSLLLVNMYPKTSVELTLSVPGFKGSASVQTLSAGNGGRTIIQKQAQLSGNDKVLAPPYSITVYQIGSEKKGK